MEKSSAKWGHFVPFIMCWKYHPLQVIDIVVATIPHNLLCNICIWQRQEDMWTTWQTTSHTLRMYEADFNGTNIYLNGHYENASRAWANNYISQNTARCNYLSVPYLAANASGTRVLNTLRPRRNGRHFADDIFKCIFLNENVWITVKISLKFVPKGPINKIPALVQIMAWLRPGDKPLSEPMMISLPTHICVTRPQWVKCAINKNIRFYDSEAAINACLADFMILHFLHFLVIYQEMIVIR